jgi:uncharacterized protein
VVVALPTEDRQRSFNFYAEGLGLEPIGEAAEDGIPEPLQFVLNQGVRLMLVPTGGFGWVTGNRPTAGRGASECLLVLTVADERRVDELGRTGSAGRAEVVLEPGATTLGILSRVRRPGRTPLAGDARRRRPALRKLTQRFARQRAIDISRRVTSGEGSPNGTQLPLADGCKRPSGSSQTLAPDDTQVSARA